MPRQSPEGLAPMPHKDALVAAEYYRRWAADNTERRSEYKRRWRADNLAKERENQHRWRDDNPERVRQYRLDRVFRNTSMLATIKIERGCVDCGYSADPTALDFDHVRGKKIAPVSRMVAGSGTDRLLEEVDKCEVRCANCHRIRTAERRTA